MTLSFSDLAEWRRQEKDSPDMIRPLPLDDLAAYLKRVQEEAGGMQMAAWDPDCEAMSAMAILDDIFLQRRHKLILCSTANEPPTPKQLYDHELTAWFGFQRVFKDMDGKNRRISTGVGL